MRCEEWRPRKVLASPTCCGDILLRYRTREAGIFEMREEEVETGNGPAMFPRVAR